MFMGTYASAGGGSTAEYGWPEHTIELGPV